MFVLILFYINFYFNFFQIYLNRNFTLFSNLYGDFSFIFTKFIHKQYKNIIFEQILMQNTKQNFSHFFNKKISVKLNPKNKMQRLFEFILFLSLLYSFSFYQIFDWLKQSTTIKSDEHRMNVKQIQKKHTRSKN